MARQQITVTEYVCDADGTEVIVRDGEKPRGYLGSITLGETTASWYACKKGCIARAARIALEKAQPYAQVSGEDLERKRQQQEEDNAKEREALDKLNAWKDV